MNRIRFAFVILIASVFLLALYSCGGGSSGGGGGGGGTPVATEEPASPATIKADLPVVITFNASISPASLTLGGTMAAESDGGVWSNTSLDNDTLTISPTGVWTDGAQTLTVAAVDVSGGMSYSLGLTYTVDSTLPVASVSPVNGANIGTDAVIVITYSETMNPASLMGSGTMWSESDSGAWGQTTEADDTLTISPGGSWSAGAQSLDVSAADIAGNVRSLALSYTVSPDADLDGFTVADGDCNDNNSTVYPGAAEVCDGVDNDCDPGTGDGAGEAWYGLACDGVDSDLCTEGSYQCVLGMQSCSDNTSSDLDVCDGVDNDCDASSVDGSEDPAIGATCDGADADLCQEGTYSCSAGALSCSDTSGDNVEICNGVDDDCDTQVDESSPNSYPNSTTICVAGADALQCDTGFEDCDTTVGTGCEVNIDSDASNCGACGASCNDSASCTQDSCSNGSCSNVPNDSLCDDTAYCNGSEVCDPADPGADVSTGCVAGTPIDCSAMTDQCNAGICNETSDVCYAQPLSAGTACDDGDPGTSGDVCDGAGVCAGVVP